MDQQAFVCIPAISAKYFSKEVILFLVTCDLTARPKYYQGKGNDEVSVALTSSWMVPVTPEMVIEAHDKADKQKQAKAYLARPKKAPRASTAPPTPNLLKRIKTESSSEEPKRKRASVFVAKDGLSFLPF
jgi:hypothetical protein